MSEKALTTLETIKILSQLWDYNPAMVYAFCQQEGMMVGFREYKIYKDGAYGDEDDDVVIGTIVHPNILFEGHKFQKHTKNKFNKTHPKLVKARDYAGSYSRQYAKLEQAKKLDFNAAILSCSWGICQILGENWGMAKFQNIYEFLKFQQSLAGQIITAMRYLATRKNTDINLDSIMRKNTLTAQDFRDIAYLYNGSGYTINRYDKNGKLLPKYNDSIAKHYKTYAILKHENIIDYSKKVQYICNQVLPKNEQLIVDGIIGEKTNRAINYLKGKKL